MFKQPGQILSSRKPCMWNAQLHYFNEFLVPGFIYVILLFIIMTLEVSSSHSYCYSISLASMCVHGGLSNYFFVSIILVL